MKNFLFLTLMFLSVYQIHAQKPIFTEFNDSLKLLPQYPLAIADIATWNQEKYFFLGGAPGVYFGHENIIWSIKGKDSIGKYQNLKTKMTEGIIQCLDLDSDGNKDECLIAGSWIGSPPSYKLQEDLVLTDYDPSTKKWKIINDTLPTIALVNSFLSWDFDNDGDIDILIYGSKYAPKVEDALYLLENISSKNKVSLRSVKTNLPISNNGYGHMEVLKCNNGTDILVFSNPSKNQVEFYKQDSFGIFSLIQTSKLSGGRERLYKILNPTTHNEDLIISLYNGKNEVLKFVNHIDSFSLKSVNANTRYKDGDVSMIDLDNDGKMDYVGIGVDKTNKNTTGLETLLDSSGTYVSRQSGMDGGEKSRLILHDLNENGYTDVLTYFGDNGWRVQLGYSNYGPDTFAKPSAPTIPSNLSSTVDGNAARLSCDSSSDNLTPTAGLQYAVRVWKQGSPNRYIRSGLYPNMGHQTRMLVTGLNWGWYYYQFRSVDPGENWSGWSGKDSFYIEKPIVLTNPLDTTFWKCHGDSVMFITEWDTTQGTPDTFGLHWGAKTGDTTKLATNLHGRFAIQADSTSTGKYFVTAWNTRNTDTSGVVTISLFTKTPVPKLSDTTICSGNTAIFTVKDSMLSYHWSTGDTTQSIQVVKSGTIHVSGIDTNGCAVSRSNVATVTIKPLPKVDLGGDMSVCSGDSVQLKNQSIDATIVSYHWSTADTTSSIWNTGGKHSLIVTDTLGCVASDSMIVRVNSLPSLSVPDTFEMCVGDSVTLVASSMDSISAFQWVSNNKSVKNRTFTVVDEGLYSINVTDTNGCVSSDSTYVEHYSTPIKPTINGDTAMCKGDSLVLSSSFPTDNHWSTGDTTSNITSSETGIVQLWRVSSYGCSSDTASIELSYLPTPTRPVFSDTDGCVGDTIRLNFHNSIKWSNGDSGSVTISTNTELVGWQVSSYGCVSDQDTLSIRIHQAPPTPEIHGMGDSLFTNQTELIHEWFYEDSLIISASVSWIKAKNKGNYRTLVKNQYGCVSDTSTTIYHTPIGINNSTDMIKLYPNPAKNWVTIETKTEVTNIVLYNASGQKIKDMNSNQKKIDVSELPEGLYILSIATNTEIYTTRLLIKE